MPKIEAVEVIDSCRLAGVHEIGRLLESVAAFRYPDGVYWRGALVGR